MTCLDDLTISLYVDGELAESRLPLAEEHIGGCAACRRKVGEFREENRLLVRSFQEIDFMDVATVPQVAVRPAALEDVFRGGAVVIGLAAVLRVLFSIGELQTAGMDRLELLVQSLQVNLISGGGAYLVEEGGAMVRSVMNGVGVFGLAMVALCGLMALARKSAAATAVLGALAMIVALSSSGFALDVRATHNGTVTVAAGETVDDTLLATGEFVVIEGTINGDLIAVAREVTINGTVKGNVIAVVQRVTVTGAIDGSFLGAGQTVEANGQIGRDMYGFGSNVDVGKNARIGGNVLEAGAETSVDGAVRRDLAMFGRTLSVGGDIGRNVLARGRSVKALSSARIGGDLTARVDRDEDLRIAEGATIGGRKIIALRMPDRSEYLTFGFYFNQVLWILATFVTGLLVFWLVPVLGRLRFTSGPAVAKTAGVGFLAVVATPIAALIAALTFVLLPVALFTLSVWFLGLFLAKIVVAAFVGRALTHQKDDQVSSVAWSLLAGLVPIAIVVNLPYVGGLVDSLLVLIGFGGMIMTLYRLRRSPAPSWTISAGEVAPV